MWVVNAAGPVVYARSDSMSRAYFGGDAGGSRSSRAPGATTQRAARCSEDGLAAINKQQTNTNLGEWRHPDDANNDGDY
jgi:hypothetical protein